MIEIKLIRVMVLCVLSFSTGVSLCNALWVYYDRLVSLFEKRNQNRDKKCSEVDKESRYAYLLCAFSLLLTIGGLLLQLL